MLAAPSQVVGVDEITRHEGSIANSSVPVVVVPSTYVPSALIVNAPATRSDPVIAADGQPAPANAGLSSPVTFRHDVATVQEPTTLPPHGASLEQDGDPAPPPVPVIPAA